MSSKLSLHALALAGIIAVSGLPALAAEMTPATPAPGAAVQSDMKAGVSTSADAKVVTGTPKDSKDLKKAAKDTKATATKDVKTAKDKAKDKTEPVQTAKLPAAQVPAPTATVNGTASTSVQH